MFICLCFEPQRLWPRYPSPEDVDSVGKIFDYDEGEEEEEMCQCCSAVSIRESWLLREELTCEG